MGLLGCHIGATAQLRPWHRHWKHLWEPGASNAPFVLGHLQRRRRVRYLCSLICRSSCQLTCRDDIPPNNSNAIKPPPPWALCRQDRHNGDGAHCWVPTKAQTLGLGRIPAHGRQVCRAAAPVQGEVAGRLTLTCRTDSSRGAPCCC
jgi:hypothetical protein